MANIKFSQFSESTDVANVDFVVGYDGATNVRISPTNFINTAGGPFLPLAGGTMTGTLTGTSATFSGNVGIGTTSPTDTLTISNDNNLLLGLKSPAGNDAQLRFYSSGNYKTIIYRPANSNDLRFNTVTSGDVLTLLQSGNVGIGTSSPNQLLELKKTSGTVTARLHADHESSPATGIEFMRGTSDTWGGDAYTDWKIGSGSSSEADFAITSKDTTSGENERVTIEYNTGNVGIGTTSPSSKLYIQQTTAGNIISTQFDNLSYTADNRNAIKIRQQATATGSFSAFLGSTQGGKLFLSNDSITADHLVIDNTGNVGIGTASPQAKLHVSDTTRIDGILFTRDVNAGYYGNAADLTLRSGAGGRTLINPSGGNVGIGTTSPESKLTIKGDPGDTDQPVRITNVITDAKTGLFINGTGNAVNQKYGMQFGGYNQYSIGGIFGVLDSTSGSTSGDITFDMANGTSSGSLIEKMRITHEGNVGIGTTTPGYKLEVDGTARITSALTFGGNVNNIITGTGSSLDFKSNGDYFFRKGANTNLTILADGNVGIGTTNPTTKFQVAGNSTYISVINTSNNKAIELGADSSGDGQIIMRDGSNNNKLLFYAEANANNYVNNGGNFGIGTASPTAKLQVVGLAEHADNAAAITAGLTTGAFYRTGDLLKVVH